MFLGNELRRTGSTPLTLGTQGQIVESMLSRYEPICDLGVLPNWILRFTCPFFFLNSWLHIQVVGFPIGLSPRTMQCLGSVQNLVFSTSRKLVSPGLSPRTMQCLGSVQNLVFFSNWGLGLPLALGESALQPSPLSLTIRLTLPSD